MDRSESGRRMHSLLAEFARIQDRGSGEGVLPALGEAMVRITTEALESGLPENMRALREHLETVAQAAEKSDLQTSGSLWNNLGMHLEDLADHEGAKRLLERALRIDEAVYDKDHPSVATIANNLGGVLQDLGELAEARKCYERARKVFREFLGEDHPSTKTVRNNLEALKGQT